MTALSEQLARAVGPIELAVDTDALANRARRRTVRRRVLQTVATVVVLSVAAIATFAVARRPGNERVQVQPPPSAAGDALVFDDGLSAVVTVDPNARVIAVRPVKIAESFHIAALVGETLVISADDSTVRAVPLAGGPARLLGSGNPAAGTQPGTVWITGDAQKVRLIDEVGRVLLEEPGPPAGRGQGACLNCPGVAVAAVPGALVFQSTTGFYVWDTGSGQVTRHIGNQPSYAAPAFGSTFPWCTQCDRALELTNVASGKTTEVALSIDGTTDALASARWSPDGTRLAIPEQVDPGRTAKVILVDVATGRTTLLDTRGRTVSVAWNRDGRRLYIAASNGHETRLTVRDLEAGTNRDIGAIPVPTLHLAAIISKDQAAHLLGAPRVASPSRCLLPVPTQSAETGSCSYSY